MIELTKSEAARKVQQYLTGRTFDGITLEVVEDDIYTMNGWWRVPVRPDVWPKTLTAYYEALADVEATIHENEDINVLLASGTPAEPEELEELAA